ncbi:MAG: nucleoside triphosphate pyrophosphohydrolase, partial [Pseudomonadota bacterium]
EEAGAFAFSDVADGITKKMVRRHPNVFGTAAQRKQGAAPGTWDRIKAEEKAEKAIRKAEQSAGQVDTTDALPTDRSRSSQLDDVPASLPALVRAVKLQKKAAKVGFDWPDLKPVLAKMREELNELETELSTPAPDTARVADEFGDLLFVMANVARHLKIDPEASLRSTNTKFTRRFQMMEACLASDNRRAEDCTLEDLDALWDRAKAAERDG